jgi:heme/copper-type cytochrome/quinol oxidase subunit 4
MSVIFSYIFYVVFTGIAAWLVVAGLMSFYTKAITIYISDKHFGFEGRKAIAAGIFTVIIGLMAVAYGLYSIYGQYVATSAG